MVLGLDKIVNTAARGLNLVRSKMAVSAKKYPAKHLYERKEICYIKSPNIIFVIARESHYALFGPDVTVFIRMCNGV